MKISYLLLLFPMFIACSAEQIDVGTPPVNPPAINPPPVTTPPVTTPPVVDSLKICNPVGSEVLLSDPRPLSQKFKETSWRIVSGDINNYTQIVFYKDKFAVNYNEGSFKVAESKFKTIEVLEETSTQMYLVLYYVDKNEVGVYGYRLLADNKMKYYFDIFPLDKNRIQEYKKIVSDELNSFTNGERMWVYLNMTNTSVYQNPPPMEDYIYTYNQ